MAVILRQRRDTAANWATNNPVIPDGQLCFDETNNTFRIGDGAANYADLSIQSGIPGDLTEIVQDTTPQLGGDLDTNGFAINTINMADSVLTRPKVLDESFTVNAIGDTGGGSDAIDVTLGNVVTATVSTAEQTFTFTNPAATGSYCEFALLLTNGGSQIVNWPASVDWPAATAPTLTAAGIDALVFWTVDAGTIWYGKLVALAFA